MIQYVFRNSAPGRLDDFLREELPGAIQKEISNSKIRRLIISGSVRVNDEQTRLPAFRLRQGSHVAVSIDEEKLFFEKAPNDISFELTEKDVLFEDDAIIVVNKPAFFPTEAGIVGSRDNLHAAVIRYLWAKNPSLKNPPYVGIMHRLDRETSGVILFTKSRAANKGCHDMFESHTAQKTYLAIVTGKRPVQAGEHFCVQMNMARTSAKSQRAKWGEDKANGLSSHTDFVAKEKMKKNGKDCVLMACMPRTGRTHQIRVHLASVGLPILGDELYGGEKSSRIHLHAQKLEFLHPLTGTPMSVSVEPDW